MGVGYFRRLSVYITCIGFVFLLLNQPNKALGFSTIGSSTESQRIMTSTNTMPFATDGMTSNLSESGVTTIYGSSTIRSSTESQSTVTSPNTMLSFTTAGMTSHLSETGVTMTHGSSTIRSSTESQSTVTSPNTVSLTTAGMTSNLSETGVTTILETIIFTSNGSSTVTHIASKTTPEQDFDKDVKKLTTIHHIIIASSAIIVIVIIVTVLICWRRPRKDPVDEIELQTGESYSERRNSRLSYGRRNSYSFYSQQNMEKMSIDNSLSHQPEDDHSGVTLTSFSDGSSFV